MGDEAKTVVEEVAEERQVVHFVDWASEWTIAGTPVLVVGRRLMIPTSEGGEPVPLADVKFLVFGLDDEIKKHPTEAIVDFLMGPVVRMTKWFALEVLPGVQDWDAVARRVYDEAYEVMVAKKLQAFGVNSVAPESAATKGAN